MRRYVMSDDLTAPAVVQIFVGIFVNITMVGKARAAEVLRENRDFVGCDASTRRYLRRCRGNKRIL